MSQPSIITSRSILMHTSLAYLSPELRTFDSILQDSFDGTLRMQSASIMLPPEILLTIRLHLLPTITTHLFKRSAHALSRYETHLRKLLCQECLSYNQEVYGPDVWGWGHFTGACLCRGIRNRIDESLTEHCRVLEYCELWNEGRAFPDCSTWLELYLSFESSRLVGCPNSMDSIWDVVGLALKDHGCRLSDRMTQPLNRYRSSSLKGMKIMLDIPTPVVIIPERSTYSLDSISSSSGSVALHRVERDLGLSCAYERGLEMWKDARSHAGIHPVPDTPQTIKSCIQSQAAEIISTMTTVVVVAVSLPITLATVALTLVCFYSSNSRALRII
ncbi:hypothetical protein H0H87_006415 [Tephrocybe sp. NHM501043]|nr:hypothetical protein H0H87_006415 [Tephrocybe sp. NHM501043]